MVFKKVKKAMIDADLTITRLAEVTGYSRPYLSKVINGKSDSKKIKKVVALALRKEFEELWMQE
jgi:transcriptional regulator with XRE-family HTH domain